jgi:hypothetical protein
MGPLFSGIAVLLLGGVVALVIFLAAALSSRARGRAFAFLPLAAFSAMAAAGFLLGCVLGVLVLMPLAGGKTLTSSIAVFGYLGAVFASGCIVAILAGRACVKLTRR